MVAVGAGHVVERIQGYHVARNGVQLVLDCVGWLASTCGDVLVVCRGEPRVVRHRYPGFLEKFGVGVPFAVCPVFPAGPVGKLLVVVSFVGGAVPQMVVERVEHAECVLECVVVIVGGVVRYKPEAVFEALGVVFGSAYFVNLKFRHHHSTHRQSVGRQCFGVIGRHDKTQLVDSALQLRGVDAAGVLHSVAPAIQEVGVCQQLPLSAIVVEYSHGGGRCCRVGGRATYVYYHVLVLAVERETAGEGNLDVVVLAAGGAGGACPVVLGTVEQVRQRLVGRGVRA